MRVGACLHKIGHATEGHNEDVSLANQLSLQRRRAVIAEILSELCKTTHND